MLPTVMVDGIMLMPGELVMEMHSPQLPVVMGLSLKGIFWVQNSVFP
jgi:hypothetical protein